MKVQNQPLAYHEDEQKQVHNKEIPCHWQFSYCFREIIIHFLQRDNTHISSILLSLNKPNDPELTEDKTGSDVQAMKPIKQDFMPNVSLGLLYFIIKESVQLLGTWCFKIRGRIVSSEPRGSLRNCSGLVIISKCALWLQNNNGKEAVKHVYLTPLSEPTVKVYYMPSEVHVFPH